MAKFKDVHDRVLRTCARVICMGGFIMTAESAMAAFGSDPGTAQQSYMLESVWALVITVCAACLLSHLNKIRLSNTE